MTQTAQYKQDEPARKVVSGQLIWADITKNTILREAFIKKKCNICYTWVFSGKCNEKLKQKKIRLLNCNIKPF